MVDIPVLLAVELPNKSLKVWCPFCRKNHIHGIGGGHRNAHCIKPTPFTETGYILKVVAG